MHIEAISDTHGSNYEVPECDVFIHAGDLSARSTTNETIREMYKIATCPGRHQLVVPGNHDIPLFKRTIPREYGEIHFLEDKAVAIEGKVFYGSPWTVPFYDWAYMLPEHDLEQVYRQMPKEIDVLITHGPAYGFCDGANLGSKALAEAIAKRKIGLHIFGHIHESGGQSKGIHHNISAMDLQYHMVRGSTRFDI